MKKMVLFLLPVLCLCGCESKLEHFTSVCSLKNDSMDIVDIKKTALTYNNKDESEKVVVTRTYKAKNNNGEIVIDGIKKSLENYNNDLAKSDAAQIKIVKDEKDLYKLKYYFDVKKLTKEELSSLEIKKNSIRYLNKLKKDNDKCE